MPLVYGAHKVTSDMVWAQDFHFVTYTPQNSNASGKGGGGSAGKGATGTHQYYYFAAFLSTLCEGPIYSFVAARDGSMWVYFNASAPVTAWPIVPGPYTPPGLIPYEGNPIALGGGLSPTPWRGGMPYDQQYFDAPLLAGYAAGGMLDADFQINPSQNQGFQQAGQHFNNVGPNVWASQAFYLAPGSEFQAYPPYIGQNHPSDIASYQYTAFWFCPSYQLGQSGTPPTLDWWIVGLLPYDPAGSIAGVPVIDADPYAVLYDLYANPVRGMGIPTTYLNPVYGYYRYIFDPVTTSGQYHNYCVAAGLFLALNLTGAMALTQITQQIMTQTVSEAWWSEGMLKILPWYDQSLNGWNATFVPNLTPVYTLGADHFLDQKNTGPVQVDRTSIWDTYNQLAMNFTNRAANYSSDTVTVDDQSDQQVRGVRPAPPAMGQFIADQLVAIVSAQLQLYKQLYFRNTYTFKLSTVLGSFLEPMDILVLNHAPLGIVNWPCRILKIDLDTKDEYSITAQGIPDEIVGIAARNQQVSLPKSLGISVPPGSIQPPLIFTGPTHLTLNTLEIWIAVTGLLAGWGGCSIFLSTDNIHYEKATTQWGGARYGSLTAPISPYGGNNPDTLDLIWVNLVGRHQTLLSVTAAQAAQGLSLSLIQTGSNFELLGYEGAKLVGANQTITGYSLSGLFRGLAGTNGIQHFQGDTFVRLDGSIAKIQVHQSMLGQTVYLKFCSFNTVGGMQEPLSSVTAYPYTIGTGVSFPSGPGSFTAGTDGKFVILTWTADPSVEVVGYQVRYGVPGTLFQQCKPVFNFGLNTHSVTLSVPTGTWVFYIASVDILGAFGNNILSSIITVPNLQALFLEQNFGQKIHALDSIAVMRPDWAAGVTGTIFTNCFAHPTGYSLALIDTSLANFSGADSGFEVFDQYCITPPVSALYQSPPITIGPGQTNVRASAQVYEYLYGLPSSINSPSGQQTLVYQQPDWSQSTIVTGFTGNRPSISWIQGGYINQTAQATAVFTFTNNCTTGNTIIVALSFVSTNSIASVVDSGGNTYSLAIGPTSAFTHSQSIYYAPVTCASQILTVTVTYGSSTGFQQVMANEEAGILSVSPVDTSGGASGTSSIASVSITTTNATDLIFAYAGLGAGAFSAGFGFTQRLTDGFNITEDRVVSNTAVYNVTAPNSIYGNWVIQAVAFEQAGVSAGSTTFPTALVGCYAHPTGYVVVPTDLLAASFSGSDNGWEVFDFTVFSPPATSTVTFLMNAGGAYPVQALLATSLSTLARPAAVPSVTGTINRSSDNVHFVQLATLQGTGQISANAVDQFFTFVVTLNNSIGTVINVKLPPGWYGATLNNAIVHPTAYCIVPLGQMAASFSGADNGFEVFDTFVNQPFPTSSVSYIINTGAVGPTQVNISDFVTAGPGQTLAANLVIATVGHSSSASGPFTTIVTGTGAPSGSLTGNATDQYFQFTVMMTNQAGNLCVVGAMTAQTTGLTPTSGGVVGLSSMLSELIVGPSAYWTPIIPQIRTGPSSTTFGPWQTLPSTFTNQGFAQFQIQWTPTATLWPVVPASVFLLTDGSPLVQTGTVAVPSGGKTVTFPTLFRQVPDITVTAQGGASVVALVVSESTSSFTVQCFTTSTGVAVAGTVGWHASGI